MFAALERPTQNRVIAELRGLAIGWLRPEFRSRAWEQDQAAKIHIMLS
jgi:hypothetical protein